MHRLEILSFELGHTFINCRSEWRDPYEQHIGGADGKGSLRSATGFFTEVEYAGNGRPFNSSIRGCDNIDENEKITIIIFDTLNRLEISI